MKITKKIWIWVCGLSLALSSVGPGLALEPVTLAYSPSLSFAPLFIAIEKGYLKDQGIDLKLEQEVPDSVGINDAAGLAPF